MKLIEGKEVSLEGVISNSAFYKGKYHHKFTDGISVVELLYNFPLDPGSIVKITGTVVNDFGSLKITVKDLKSLSAENYSKIQELAENSIQLKAIDFLVQDSTMDKMKDTLISISKKLKASKILGRKVLVKFHNDGDGISGALSLQSFLKASFDQQKSAIYEVRDAIKDLNKLTNSNHPILVLVDFGSSIENKDGLALLKAGGVDVIIIDHHPPSEDLKQYLSVFLNPWFFDNSDNSSKYAAGYLCAEIARMFGKDCKNYAKISLCSDKSELLEISQEEKETSIVLNYAAAYSSYSSNLDFYSNLLSNDVLFQSILYQAQEKIDQLISLSKKHLKKKQIGKFHLFTINLGSLIKRYEFPGLGKSATQIFEALLPQDKPALLICYGPRTLVFRINNIAVKEGADSLEIISHIKKVMAEIVESGGGHTRAAALRVKPDFETSALQEIEDFLKLK